MNGGSERAGGALSARVTPFGTRIPLRQTAQAPSRMTPPHTPEPGANNTLAVYVERWKCRYEDAERRHKASVVKNEKVQKDYGDLQRKYNLLQEECNQLERELTERERELAKLRTVSEKVYKEYTQLRNEHDIDRGVMQKVMSQAGEWYKQNRKLKRRSTALALAPHDQTAVDVDSTDANDSGSETSSEEFEFLKQTVSDLTKQIAELQTELSAAKLQEFEATENCVNLTQELETERSERLKLSQEVSDLRSQLERHERVSKLLLDQVSALRREAGEEKERADTMRCEARTLKKRATVLAHQSALLMGDLPLDERMMTLLQEVDSLKESLESQAMRHEDEIQQLQLKLADKFEESDAALWEEKLKLSEEECEKATQRALAAERRVLELQNKPAPPPKKSNLMSRINYFEGVKEEPKEAAVEEVIVSVKEEVLAVPPPPPPPPMAAPPPPPPPPPPPAPPAVFVGNSGGTGSAIADMANLLGLKHGSVKKENKSNAGIDAIVDEIKTGKFHLRSRDGGFLERRCEPEQPEAVKEMLSVLGTLRKRRSRPLLTQTSVEKAYRGQS